MSKNWSVNAEIRAEQKAALKDMPFKKKIVYYWTYYWLQTAIIVGACVIIGSLVANIISNKPYSFYAMFINSFIMEDVDVAAAFATFADLDEANAQCVVETTALMEGADFAQHAFAMSQRIMATIMAGDLDVMVSDGQTFMRDAYNEIFIDLRLVMDAGELSRYSDNLFYVDQSVLEAVDEARFDLEEIERRLAANSDEWLTHLGLQAAARMTAPVPVGILVTDSALFDEIGAFPVGSPIFGIIANSSRVEVALDFLTFIMD